MWFFQKMPSCASKPVLWPRLLCSLLVLSFIRSEFESHQLLLVWWWRNPACLITQPSDCLLFIPAVENSFLMGRVSPGMRSPCRSLSRWPEQDQKNNEIQSKGRKLWQFVYNSITVSHFNNISIYGILELSSPRWCLACLHPPRDRGRRGSGNAVSLLFGNLKYENKFDGRCMQCGNTGNIGLGNLSSGKISGQTSGRPKFPTIGPTCCLNIR